MRSPLVLAASALCFAAIACGIAMAQTITVGTINLTACNKAYDGYCGTLARPLDPSGRVPGSISIGFEWYPYSDTAQPGLGTIIAQEGGPGYSTTGSRDGYVRLLTPLRARRNILLIDKRGTGRSGAINCPMLQRARLPSLTAVQACGWQLGRSAWLYGSTFAADDVAAVLGALGTGAVDYYGDSYATYFGQVFATRHPDLVRTIVLDSAYPVIGQAPFFPTEIGNGPIALEKVCARSAACRALGSSVTERFAALLASLRATPVHGTAPGANGALRPVTADAPGLFLAFYEAGNNLILFRDLDAAGRAYLAHGDTAPLLRLVAEAEDAGAGGGPASQFSTGLADAVVCSDYRQVFDMRAPEATRRAQFTDAIARRRQANPVLYAPFTLDEGLAAPGDPEQTDTCIVWPDAPSWASPGHPISDGTAFPNIPVLVLAGELDTVTSPREAAQTTALFPKAWFVVVRNTGHETAVGDGGVFVPPNGADLAGCAGGIVTAFIASGGDPGDTSCALRVRPIRPVSNFVQSWRDAPPVMPSGQTGFGRTAVPSPQLALADAATETIGDAVARYFVTTSGRGLGLRGGKFHISPTKFGYVIHMDHARWCADLAVSGTITWNQLNGDIAAAVTLLADGHKGALQIAWNDRDTNAQARILGQIDGHIIEAARLAP